MLLIYVNMQYNYVHMLHYLKSLNLIYFVKIRLPDFLFNEFLIKMYRLLQNYTFEICNLWKIMNFCCKYDIFLYVGPNLQSIER